MDSLQKWSAFMADLRTLCAMLRKQELAGLTNRRFREINSICLFALCVENNEKKRFLVGFQQKGIAEKPVLVSKLFEDGFAEEDDVDVILVPDLGPEGPTRRDIHRIQLVSYLYRPNPDTADLIEFLEQKKLRRAKRDDDLILLVHVEQMSSLDYVELAHHLYFRRPKCPFSQVFMLGEVSRAEPKRWLCMQLYPRLATLRELDFATAIDLVVDRPTACVEASD